MDPDRVDALAAAYREGDDPALRPLVEVLARPLLARAYGIVHDWDLAADLVQETWLRVVGAIAGYDPGRPFRPWIGTILRRLCWQHLARAAREPGGGSLAAAEEAAAGRPGDDPERAAGDADLRRRLLRHLAALPRTQRLAIVLVDLEQRDRREVSAQLDLTPASLRVILCRARRTLAVRLLAEETP